MSTLPAVAIKYFKKRDDDLPQPSAIWSTLLYASGWQPSDGPCPGVWKKRRPGHRCLTSCKWSTSSFGLVDPDRLIGVELMTTLQLLHEAVDFLQAGGHDFTKQLGGLVCSYFLGEIVYPETWPVKIGNSLRALRQTYPEFTFVGDIPPMSAEGQRQGQSGRLVHLKVRPSWGDRATVLQELGGPR